MSRSLNRHHKQRMKDKFIRKQKLHPLGETSDKAAGIYTKCKALCSCAMCGNPRKIYRRTY